MDLFPGLPYDPGLECLIRIPHHYLSSLASVCRTWNREVYLPEFWTRRKASGLTRKLVAVAQARVDPTRNVGSKKHAIVPVYRVALCEPDTGSCSELPPVPGLPEGLPMYCQLVGVGLNLVVMGGLDPVTWEVSNSVFVFNFVSATWRRGADIPGCRRLFFACASDSDRAVFVAGGHDGDKGALKSAMAYDVARDEWTSMPDMASERDESKGVFHRGKFHVISGYTTSAQGRFGTSAESFDATTWQWDSVEDEFLGGPFCPSSCVSNEDGEFFMCHGTQVVARQGVTWRAVAELPPQVKITAYVTAWHGKMMVIGSEIFGGAHKTFVLDLNSRKWETVENGDDYSGHVQSGCCLEL